jgi:hypothetical protein
MSRSIPILLALFFDLPRGLRRYGHTVQQQHESILPIPRKDQ